MENIVAAIAVKSVLLFLEWNDLELPTHGLPDFFIFEELNYISLRNDFVTSFFSNSLDCSREWLFLKALDFSLHSFLI